jgi:hypothetical protein
VIGSSTELVIDGYTRSATTFAVYAFQLAQVRPVRLAHHLHAPAQLIAAAKMGVPVLALIREPEGAILSQLVREPRVELRDALVAYTRFYSYLLPHRRGFVVGEFDQVTRDFGGVVRRLNERFGTSFEEFLHTDANVRECYALIKERPTLSSTLLGFESGLVSREELGLEQDRLARRPQLPGTTDVWLPSAERNRAKAVLLDRWWPCRAPGSRAGRLPGVPEAQRIRAGMPVDGAVARSVVGPVRVQPRPQSRGGPDTRDVAVGLPGMPLTGIPGAHTAPEITGAVVPGGRLAEPLLPAFIAATELTCEIVDGEGGRVPVEGERAILVIRPGSLSGILPRLDPDDGEGLRAYPLPGVALVVIAVTSEPATEDPGRLRGGREDISAAEVRHAAGWSRCCAAAGTGSP